MKKIALVLVALFCTLTVLQAQTYNATVAKDGSGTHTTVAAAISSAPVNGTTPYYILVKSGVYNEKDTVPTNRPNVVMVGENVLTTVIYNNDNATTTLVNGNPIGTSGSSAFFVNGASFTAFNITFQNNAGVAASQAVAVNISGDKAAFRNCRFLGFQDVLYCKNSGVSSYFKNCYIEGTVDFIFGASTSYFDSCYIFCKSRQSGGVITAPNTAAGTSFGSPWGFVFNNCKINGASGMTSLYYLGRPWQNKPQSVYLNCAMSDVILGLGWSSASAGSATTADASFGEYNSSGAGGGSGSRAAFSTQLSAGQAATYTASNVLGSWDPCGTTGVCNAVDLPIATANFAGTQINSTSASFSWNMCWPLAMTYTLRRSTNGGSFSTVDNFSGSNTTYNYSSADNSMPTGVNRYILQMTSGATTLTSTDTITISNQPTVTTSVSSLSAFTQTIGTPSYTQVLSVSGANLTGNITVTAPTNFQVSANGTTWVSSYSITQSGGSVTSNTVSVRLNAGSNGSYSGNITFTSSGATTVNVAVSGTTSAVPAYTATLLQQWPFTTSAGDSAGVRAIGINASTPTLLKLLRPNGSVSAVGSGAYHGTFGQISGPDTIGATSSRGLWSVASGFGNGNTLTRTTLYEQFTISGQTGYSERIDSIILNCNFYNTTGKLAFVYSKSGFVSDSADITVGGTLNGTALGGSAFGAFASPIALTSSTSGPTANFRLPINGSTGVNLASGETLTIRMYVSCGSSSSGRYLTVKNLQVKGSVTAPAPTVSSFTPTSQVAAGTVVITGTNFSGVTAVTFGGTAAASYTVNSGTQITATIGAGTSGSVSVTTASGTGSAAGFTFQTPTTYYNIASSDVTNVNNWGINTNGSGTHPSNFTANLQTFKIANTGATMSGAWTVSGTNSKIVVGNGSAVFNQTQVITGTIDVEDNGDLEIKVSVDPTLGTLYNGSTVGYSGSGIAQSVTAANYYNLTLSGSGARNFPTGVVGIANQFTTNSYTAAGTNTVVSFNGTSPQTIPPFTYDSLIVNNTNGCLTQGGGSAVIVNKGMNVLQNFTVDAGDLVTLAGSNGVSFTVASGKTLTVTGTLDNQSLGTVTWGGLASSASASTAANADSARFVVNSGGIYKINAAVSNAYYIAVGNFKPGSELLILQGSPRIPYYIGANVTWSSTGVGTFVQQATNSVGGNLTINAGQLNNGSGGTGRTLNIYGKLKIQGGEYEPAGLGNTSAQIVNVFDSIVVTSGNLYPTLSTTGGTGTINAYGNVAKAGGNIDNASAAVIGGVIAFLGTAPQAAPPFSSNIGLLINNTSGVTFAANATVGNITLTNGIVNMSSNTLASSGTVSRTNGWVRGTLRKAIGAGSSIAATFEIGDATNYLPVSLTFGTVSVAGDVAVSFNTPLTAVTNYATAPISSTAYVNKYWTLTNVNTLAFTNYSATLNYLSADLLGGATASSVIGKIYTSSWANATTASGINANTLSSLTGLGNIILANACTAVTPSVSISTANATVCSANNISFSATATNGGTAPSFQWKKNGVDAGSGSSITFLAGTVASGDTITCVLTANNNCQTTPTATSNKIGITVIVSPSIGSSTGGSTICTIGGTKAVYNSNTNGGGVWSSNATSVATVSTVSGASGLVTAVSNGTAILTYSKTGVNGCVSTATTTMIVAAATTPNSITGTLNVCKGLTTALATTSTGGVWGSLNTFANISSGGVVTGLSAGAASIRYTVTNASGCSAYAAATVTVNAIPNLPSIAYAVGTVNPQYGPGGTFCAGKTFTVVGSPSGGSWSSSNNAVITVTGGGGVVNTIAPGSAILTYTYTNGSGCSNSRSISGTVATCASRGINGQSSMANDLLTTDFTIYPNPATTSVSLQMETLVGFGQIVITDLYGKQVKTQPLSMGNNAINIASLAKGMYFISTITNEGKTTKKLIVE